LGSRCSPLIFLQSLWRFVRLEKGLRKKKGERKGGRNTWRHNSKSTHSTSSSNHLLDSLYESAWYLCYYSPFGVGGSDFKEKGKKALLHAGKRSKARAPSSPIAFAGLSTGGGRGGEEKEGEGKRLIVLRRVVSTARPDPSQREKGEKKAQRGRKC